jgi:predicted ATP-grasp superfamily ATP-dependent carboligase
MAAHGAEGFVVFATSDETTALLARNYEALSECFHLTTSRWDVTRFGYDKRLTYQLADEVGVDYPQTWYPASREDVLALDCTFPVVLKPAVKTTLNRFTHDKAWRADDARALVGRYDEARKLVPADVIIIQELVPGGGTGQFSYAAICSNGRPLAHLVARRLRQYPVDFGHSSSYVETVHEPEVERTAEALLRALGYTGLVEVELKRDARNRGLKLLDVNLRVWTWHSLGARSGLDFPYLAWRLARDIGVAPSRAKVGVRWVRTATDVPAAVSEIVSGRLSISAYLRSYRRPLEFALLAADDLAPTFLGGPFLIRRLVTRASKGLGM